MSFSANVLLIGAQKSGTTTLIDYLSHHPKICVSTPKEPDFYTRHFDRGFEWYRSLFSDPTSPICMEGSTSYTMLNPNSSEWVKRCAERVAAHAPAAKLIYIMRDPVARTYSSYCHAVRAGEEELSLREAIATTGTYLAISDYAFQLRHWYQYFPPERFLLLFFEEFTQSPQPVVDRICRFLDLAPFSLPSQQERKNVSFQYTPTARFARRLLGSNERFERGIALGKRLIPTGLKSTVARLITQRNRPLNADERRLLMEYFAPKVADLEQLTGLNTSSWWQINSSSGT